MPEPEVEYAVRTEWGEMFQRPDLALALASVDGIRAHGGTAVLLSRTVTRSDWAEAEDPRDVEVPRYPVTDAEIAALPILDLGAFQKAEEEL